MKHLILLLAFLSVSSLASAQIDYLATYEGDGTEANPFRATSNILGTGCKSLRPDETKQGGYALCKGPRLPVREGVIDLSGKRAITKADRDAISADRGLTITATTFDGLITELVDKQNVKLGLKAGRQQIIVNGEEMWSRPAPLASYLPDVLFAPVAFVHGLFVPALAWADASITETFTCADDSDGNYTCDHAWTRAAGTVAAIVSNTLRSVNSTSLQRMRITGTALDSTNMAVTVEVANIARGTATDVAGGPIARNPSDGTATYLYCVLRDGASDEIELGHVVAGTQTADASVAATAANGDTVTLTATTSNEVSCAHNGVVVAGPITEATGSGNVYIGARISGSGTATTTSVVLDNVTAAEPVGASTFGPLKRRAF